MVLFEICKACFLLYSLEGYLLLSIVGEKSVYGSVIPGIFMMIPHWLCMFKDIALFYWHTLTLVWVERAFFIFNSEHCFCTCVALCYRRHYNRAKIECLLCFILYELCMGWDWLHSLNSYLFQSNCPDVPDFYNYLQYEWSGFPSNYYF